MMTLVRILTFALPVVIAIATFEGLVLALVMRRNYNWRAYFASRFVAGPIVAGSVVVPFWPAGLATRRRTVDTRDGVRR
jgi:hypothetical protein